MIALSKQVERLLQMKNCYEHDISLYCNVLSYLTYFQEAQEQDYIKYHNDNSFEYTPEFYAFIKALFDAKLVEDVDEMTKFLESYNSSTAYKNWICEMNQILSNDQMLEKASLSFIRKAILSMIRLERVLPGSWGIDVETGNWLKLLTQLKRIFPEIYRTENRNLN